MDRKLCEPNWVFEGRTADIKSNNDMVAWIGDRHCVLNISSPARGVGEGGGS
jgi:hypothetical protein